MWYDIIGGLDTINMLHKVHANLCQVKKMAKVVKLKDYTLKRKGKKSMCRELVEEIHRNRIRGYTYTLAEMKLLAERFLKSVHYSGEGAVPAVKIAQDCGFKIITGSMKDSEMSGFISINKENKAEFGTDMIIGVNGDDEIGHQRFVIIHELAHYLFDYDMTDKPYFDTYRKNSHKDLKEQIANLFAANILMPTKRFVLEFDEAKTMKSNAEHWAEYFDVQEKAARKRVAEVMMNGL